MQNKGFIKVFAVALVLVCIYYLSFSFVTRHYEKKAAGMEAKAAQIYLDSLKNEKVWFGAYTLKQCQEMQIGLGLDLKGGMNVVLEVSVPDVIKSLADHSTDPNFTKAIAEATVESQKSQDDVITLFVRPFFVRRQKLLLRIHTMFYVLVLTVLVLLSQISKTLRDKWVALWLNSLVSKNLIVFVNYFKVVRIWNSGKLMMQL